MSNKLVDIWRSMWKNMPPKNVKIQHLLAQKQRIKKLYSTFWWTWSHSLKKANHWQIRAILQIKSKNHLVYIITVLTLSQSFFHRTVINALLYILLLLLLYMSWVILWLLIILKMWCPDSVTGSFHILISS